LLILFSDIGGDCMFSIIDDILSVKNGKSLERSDFDDEFKLYMVQRWISMHSDFNVEILNRTVNSLYNTLSARQQFELMLMILPSTGVRRKYIKPRNNNPSKKVKDDGVDLSGNYEESISKIDESLKYVMGDKYE
jgi:hypothetical protein